MLVLVMNSGSSSLKFQLLDMENGEVQSKGVVERIGLGDTAGFEVKAKGQKLSQDVVAENHKQAVALVVDALTKGDLAVVKDLSGISAIGHRIVQGGDSFPKAAVVDQWVKDKVKFYGRMAPLHNYAAHDVIEACEELMPGVPAVCVFDTSFHMTMDPAHFMYAIPYEDYEELKVRRYGAHGTSHKYVSRITAKQMGVPVEDLKIITCHLGNGASISAIKDGKIMDTSMGFTPLEGLVMGTRTGNIDPAAVLYIMKNKGYTPDQMDTYVNKKSGLLGLSGLSNDFRDIEEAMDAGNERAQLAYDMFVLRCKQYIGAYYAELNGVDAVAFTAGIGENDDRVRESICADLEALGIKIDNAKNAGKHELCEITGEGSKARVFIVPTNEEYAIAIETLEAIEEAGMAVK